MGKRGPKPKPLAIRQLEGNPGRVQMPDPEFVITSGLPVVIPPEIEADDIANAEFRRIIEAMPRGVYEALDTAVLSVYAQSWSLFWRAQRDIDMHGTVIIERTEKHDSDGGSTVTEKMRANPAVAIWQTAATNLLKTADRLGLVPGVRAKLQLPDKRDKPGRPPKPRGFADLMPEA